MKSISIFFAACCALVAAQAASAACDSRDVEVTNSSGQIMKVTRGQAWTAFVYKTHTLNNGDSACIKVTGHKKQAIHIRMKAIVTANTQPTSSKWISGDYTAHPCIPSSTVLQTIAHQPLGSSINITAIVPNRTDPNNPYNCLAGSFTIG